MVLLIQDVSLDEGVSAPILFIDLYLLNFIKCKVHNLVTSLRFVVLDGLAA